MINYNFIKSLSHEEAFLFLLKESFDTNDFYMMQWVFNKESSYYQFAEALFKNEPISPDFFNNKNNNYSDGFLRKAFALTYAYPETILNFQSILINHFMKKCLDDYYLSGLLINAKNNNRLILPTKLLTNNYSVYSYWKSSNWKDLIPMVTDEKKPMNIFNGTTKNILRKKEEHTNENDIDPKWIEMLFSLERPIDIEAARKLIKDSEKSLINGYNQAPLKCFSAIFETAYSKDESAWLNLFNTIIHYARMEGINSVNYKWLESSNVINSWNSVKELIIPKIEMTYPNNIFLNCILNVLNKTPFDQFLQQESSYSICQNFVQHNKLANTNYWYNARNQLREWCIPLEQMNITIPYGENQRSDLGFFITSDHSYKKGSLAVDAENGFNQVRNGISEVLGWKQNQIPDSSMDITL